MCLLKKKKSVECSSDVNLFINPNKFLFEMYLISLLPFSLVVFLVLKWQFEGFSPATFFIQLALEMWWCSGAVALWQLFCKLQCLLLQILLLARNLIFFYGSYNHNFLIVGMILCSYCCAVSLQPPLCQRPKTDRGYEAGSENTAAIYWFVCLPDCWHWAGFIIFVF